MKALEIKKDVYWVGAIDWNLRFFHGYTTEKGSTYNAYLIVDDKITLVDTVKGQFAAEMISRISDIIDPAKIDYVIANHVEMDHSGAIPDILKYAPNAKVVASSPKGIYGLKAHYGDYEYVPVKLGDTLNIGKRTLKFIPTPMVHWPDNMFTYSEYDSILFSNDAFGQHYASSGRFDDTVPYEDVMLQARKYYANIVMPYAQPAKNAATAASGLMFDHICPSHGIIFRKYIPDILENYNKWYSNSTEDSAVVVYDSMWHSTEKIAKTISEAFIAKNINVYLRDLNLNHSSDIMSEILTAKYIAVGSSTLNNNMLPSVASFLCYLKGLAPKNRKAFAFGSYGWSGQSVEQVEKELLACGFELFTDKIKIEYIPTKEQLSKIYNDIVSKL